MSIRQQALRGIAKVQLERGDRKAALHQYERILGKALIGRGPPAEPWAHSEYAWLLFEDGNLEVRGMAEVFHEVVVTPHHFSMAILWGWPPTAEHYKIDCMQSELILFEEGLLQAKGTGVGCCRGGSGLGFALGMSGCDIPQPEPCSQAALLSSCRSPYEAVLRSIFRISWAA